MAPMLGPIHEGWEKGNDEGKQSRSQKGAFGNIK